MTEINFNDLTMELETLNDNLSAINENLQAQEQELKKISASFNLLTYLLQFNLGVNVNNTSLYDISQHLKEIKDRI